MKRNWITAREYANKFKIPYRDVLADLNAGLTLKHGYVGDQKRKSGVWRVYQQPPQQEPEYAEEDDLPDPEEWIEENKSSTALKAKVRLELAAKQILSALYELRRVNLPAYPYSYDRYCAPSWQDAFLFEKNNPASPRSKSRSKDRRAVAPEPQDSKMQFATSTIMLAVFGVRYPHLNVAATVVREGDDWRYSDVQPAQPWLFNEIVCGGRYRDLLDSWLHEITVGILKGKRDMKPITEIGRCLYCYRKRERSSKSKTCSSQCRFRFAGFCERGTKALRSSNERISSQFARDLQEQLSIVSKLHALREAVGAAPTAENRIVALKALEEQLRAIELDQERTDLQKKREEILRTYRQ